MLSFHVHLTDKLFTLLRCCIIGPRNGFLIATNVVLVLLTVIRFAKFPKAVLMQPIILKLNVYI